MPARVLRTRRGKLPAAQPLLDAETDGVGFAPTCDFHKGAGYLGLAKPDDQGRKEILWGLGRRDRQAGNQKALAAIVRTARHTTFTSYAADRIPSLQVSCKFFSYPDLSRKGRNLINGISSSAQHAPDRAARLDVRWGNGRVPHDCVSGNCAAASFERHHPSHSDARTRFRPFSGSEPPLESCAACPSCSRTSSRWR